MKKKILVPVVAMGMMASAMVGGTLAYLADTTDEVQNVFTVGNVDIELDETTKEFKMVPGQQIAKDPKVTVKVGSEPCYVFVKVDENETVNEYLTWAHESDDWTLLNGTENIYYLKNVVETSDEDQEFYFLDKGEADTAYANGYVTTKESVDKDMMEEIKNGFSEAPTLTFTAYAIQKAGMASAEDAWQKALTEGDIQ